MPVVSTRGNGGALRLRGPAALAGVLLLATGPAGLALAGAGALLAYHLLDKVDGDVARYRRSFSIVGVYLDEVGHGIAFGGLFLGLGIHLAWDAGSVGRAMLALAAGGLGATAMVLARQHKSAGFLLYAQYILVQPALMPEGGADERPHPLSREGAHQSRRGEGNASGAAALGTVRDTILMLADFITVLALVITGLVIQLLTGSAAFLTAVLVVEAGLQILVLLALYWINATTNIRSECLRLDALARDRAARMP